MKEYREKTEIQLEEKPIIELPRLIIIFMGCFFICVALGLLFFPWYITLFLYISIMLLIGIFFNPFISIPLYLVGAFMRPLAFAPELAEYQLPVIGAFVILLTWFFHITVYKDFKMPKTGQWFFYFVFAFISLFSALVYWDSSRFMFLELLKVLILYFLVATLVKSKRHILTIVFFILALGFLTALYAVYQQTHGLGQHLGGGIIRPTGFEGDPNYLAMDLVILIPLVLGLFLSSRSIIMKAVLASIFILFLAVIGFTFSRAGALGTAAVLLLCGWKFFIGRRGIQYLLIMAMIFALIFPYIPVKYIERIVSIVNLSEVSIKGRLDGFIVGFLLIKDHPFIGVGVGRWVIEYWQKAITLPDIMTKVSWFPHNIFVEIGTEMGILSLVAFLSLLFYMFKDLILARRIVNQMVNDQTLSIVIQAMQISLIGFLVCASFVAAVYLKLFWMLAGFSIALKQVALEYRK